MSFPDFLRHRLASPLPGWDAQRRMAPYPGEIRSLAMPAPELIRKAAVLIPLVEQTDQAPLVVLTVRSAKLNHHGGQISFPGGRMDGNETVVDTALREAQEEVGLPSHEVQVLGQLTELYVPPSRSHITPVVGLLKALPPMTLQPTEVDEAFTVPLNHLADPAVRRDIEREIFDGSRVSVPTWHIHPTTPLWGATAMILAELLHLWAEYEQVQVTR